MLSVLAVRYGTDVVAPAASLLLRSPCGALSLPLLQPFPKLPVPEWQLGQPVQLAQLTAVADTYFKALEPSRKLRTPALPAQVTEQLTKLGNSMGSDGADLKVRLLGGGREGGRVCWATQSNWQPAGVAGCD